MFSSGCEALCIEVCHHSFHGGVCGAQLTQPLLLSWNFHLRGHNNGYGYSSATSRSLHDDEEIGHWEKNVKLGGCWHLICALMCLFTFSLKPSNSSWMRSRRYFICWSASRANAGSMTLSALVTPAACKNTANQVKILVRVEMLKVLKRHGTTPCMVFSDYTLLANGSNWFPWGLGQILYVVSPILPQYFIVNRPPVQCHQHWMYTYHSL